MLVGAGGARPRFGGARRARRAAPDTLPAMRIEATTDAPLQTGADTIAVGVFDGEDIAHDVADGTLQRLLDSGEARRSRAAAGACRRRRRGRCPRDRQSTRLNRSHVQISYAG